MFTKDQIFKFINSADNQTFLTVKLVILFCYYGALRMSECCYLLRDSVNETAAGLLVKVIRKKTDKAQLGQTFVVPKIEDPNVCFYNPLDLWNDYRNLTRNNTHKRLWLQRDAKTNIYKNIPIGKNMMGKFTVIAAEFLKLEDPLSYTSHALRATSATVLADSGVSLENLKRHGQWKSTSVVEGYIHDSIKHKTDTANSLTTSSTNTTTTSTSSSTNSSTPNCVGAIFVNCVFEGNVQYSPLP